MSGRGFGKTRTGGEDISEYCRTHPGSRIALVGPSLGDVRDTMVEGESGLLAVLPDAAVKTWNRSLAALELDLVNGCHLKGFSAERPDRLRGPQHHRAWCDELAAWKYPRDTWDQLMFGLRLGRHPQVIVTTTPRPTPLVKELRAKDDTHLTTGSTYDNLANLAPTLAKQILARYEGTSLGRQELYGEIVDQIDGALWTLELIDQFRVERAPDLERIVVAIDPAMTSGEDADSTGIVVAGRLGDHFYVLEDATLRGSPQEWATRAVAAHQRHNADRVVGEVNAGGEMVEHTLRTVARDLPYRSVHASRGKRVRAEPIAALYEQGRVHHVGCFAALEDEMISWTPDAQQSPDRMDALVWALTDLMATRKRARMVSSSRR